MSARTTLPTRWPDEAVDEPWAVRVADLDIVGHVNNAAQWMAVEEALDHAGWDRGPVRAELEHGPGVERGTDVRLRWVAVDGGVDTWLTTAWGGDRHARRVAKITAVEQRYRS